MSAFRYICRSEWANALYMLFRMCATNINWIWIWPAYFAFAGIFNCWVFLILFSRIALHGLSLESFGENFISVQWPVQENIETIVVTASRMRRHDRTCTVGKGEERLNCTFTDLACHTKFKVAISNCVGVPEEHNLVCTKSESITVTTLPTGI